MCDGTRHILIFGPCLTSTDRYYLFVVGCLPNAYDSTSFISSNFSMKTDYFTTERPTNRLPCSKDERKKMKCVNKGTCFVVVIKDHRLRACQ